jgi:type I site-specific restriction-modification system R (restriction) subunit
MELNPGLPEEAYREVVRKLTSITTAQTLMATNREKYELIKDGVKVTFRNEKGERVRQRLRVRYAIFKILFWSSDNPLPIFVRLFRSVKISQ